MLDSLVVFADKIRYFFWFMIYVSFILFFQVFVDVVLTALVGHVIFTC